MELGTPRHAALQGVGGGGAPRHEDSPPAPLWALRSRYQGHFRPRKLMICFYLLKTVLLFVCCVISTLENLKLLNLIYSSSYLSELAFSVKDTFWFLAAVHIKPTITDSEIIG